MAPVELQPLNSGGGNTDRIPEPPFTAVVNNSSRLVLYAAVQI